MAQDRKALAAGVVALFLIAMLLSYAMEASFRAARAEAGVEDMVTPQGRPQFIGYGCEGTTGAIWANDEDVFPRCAAIERVR